jgi:hypothetical protein
MKASAETPSGGSPAFTLDTYQEVKECLYEMGSPLVLGNSRSGAFPFRAFQMNNLPELSRVMREDLRAQLAPLDRYGPVGLATAAVSWLRTLVGATLNAVGANVCCCPGTTHSIDVY